MRKPVSLPKSPITERGCYTNRPNSSAKNKESGFSLLSISGQSFTTEIKNKAFIGYRAYSNLKKTDKGYRTTKGIILEKYKNI
jgi:hypothetical protein